MDKRVSGLVFHRIQSKITTASTIIYLFGHDRDEVQPESNMLSYLPSISVNLLLFDLKLVDSDAP